MKTMNRWIFGLYISILIFAPLSLGARNTGSVALIETGCLMTCVLYLIELKRQNKPFYNVPGIVPLVLLAVYMAFQAVPLPAGIVRFISPSAFDIYNKTAGVDSPLTFIPLTVDIKSTLIEFFRVSSYILFYILTVQILENGRRFKKTVLILSFTAGLIAVYALVEKFFSNGKIYWLFSIPDGNNHIGPFVYKNHYAGFVEMVFPVVFGAFMYYRPHINYGTLKENVIELFTRPEANIHILLGFFALLIATSQFVSLSRGGVICLSLSMSLFFILAARRRKVRRKNIMIMTFICLVVFSVGWFGWDKIFQNFEDSLSQGLTKLNGRTNFWQDSMGIIRDFPLTGSGFGSFCAIYPAYRTYPGELVVDHAHNDCVELAATGGLIGFFLVGWFICSVFVASIKAFSKRKGSYSAYLFYGTLSGLAAIVLHSTSDFNFYSNSNGLYIFFLAGLLVSSAHTRFKSKKSTYLHPMKYFKPVYAIIPVAFLLLMGLRFNTGILVGQIRFRSLEGTVIDSAMKDDVLFPIKKTVSSAVSSDPFEAEYRMALGLVSDYLGEDGEARNQYRKAVFLNPEHGEILQRFGNYLLHKGEKEKADALMNAGLDRCRNDVERYKHYAAYLLHSKSVDMGLSTIRTAIEIDPTVENVKSCVAIILDSGLDLTALVSAMPEKVAPRYYLADYLRTSGEPELARHVENEAILYVDHEKNVGAWMFSRLYRRKVIEKDYQGALDIIVLGLSYLSDNLELLLDAGDMYDKLGLKYKAVEEYRKAEIIDPNNQIIRKKRETLESAQ